MCVLRVAAAEGVLYLAYRARVLSRGLPNTLSDKEAAGPHTTGVGRVRQLLAALRVLDAPRDPLRECGVQEGQNTWWAVFWHFSEAGRRLECLQENTVLALEEHETFTHIVVLACDVLAVVGLACLGGWMLLPRAWRARAAAWVEARPRTRGTTHLRRRKSTQLRRKTVMAQQRRTTTMTQLGHSFLQLSRSSFLQVSHSCLLRLS